MPHPPKHYSLSAVCCALHSLLLYFIVSLFILCISQSIIVFLYYSYVHNPTPSAFTLLPHNLNHIVHSIVISLTHISHNILIVQWIEVQHQVKRGEPQQELRPHFLHHSYRL